MLPVANEAPAVSVRAWGITSETGLRPGVEAEAMVNATCNWSMPGAALIADCEVLRELFFERVIHIRSEHVLIRGRNLGVRCSMAKRRYCSSERTPAQSSYSFS